MAIHQRRCGGEHSDRWPVPVILWRRKIKIQLQHIPLFLYELGSRSNRSSRGGRQRSVSSHMAAEGLAGGEFRSTNRTLMNLGFDEVSGGGRRRTVGGGQLQGELDWIGGCKMWVLLLLLFNRISKNVVEFGLFMASSMTTQGLKRRKTTIASFALIKKQRFISSHFLFNKNRGTTSCYSTSTLRQKNQTISQILILFFFFG